jgi:predicted GNAT family acetyltransferase
MNIKVQHDALLGQFLAVVDGHRAVLDYTLTGQVMNIIHTGVPEAIGGRSIASDLMRSALATAAEAGWSVNAECSYAQAYLRKHPYAAG